MIRRLHQSFFVFVGHFANWYIWQGQLHQHSHLKVFALIDDDIRMTFCQCNGVDMSDTAWQQGQLSPSRGVGALGFGHCPTTHHSSFHLLILLFWLWSAVISPSASRTGDLQQLGLTCRCSQCWVSPHFTSLPDIPFC